MLDKIRFWCKKRLFVTCYTKCQIGLAVVDYEHYNTPKLKSSSAPNHYHVVLVIILRFNIYRSVAICKHYRSIDHQ